MFERTLIPLDGSAMAEMALPYGVELAERLGTKLVLYHVCGLERQPQINLHQVYLNNQAEKVKRILLLSHRDLTDDAVTTKVEVGEPRENVCSLVEQNQTDLIVMTAIGSSGLKVGKMIGSVADHICRNVPVPVLLIRPHQNEPVEKNPNLISRIFLTVDGSELSMRAVPVAEELATRLNIPVTLFQMAHIIVPYNEDVVDDTINYSILSDAAEQTVRTEMESLEAKLRDKGIIVNSIVVPGASAADEIIDGSKKAGADIIVMSTHGRSGVSRFLLGAVAEKVLRHSEVPVLLVNARAS